jgi:hypothetical protein
MKTLRTIMFVTAAAAAAATGCIADGEELAELDSEIVVDTGSSGGTGGLPFHTTNADPSNKIIGIQVRSANEVDALRVIYANGLVEAWGGSGGSWNPVFEIFPGEELVKISGKAGLRVDSIVFTTSTGRVSQVYGGRGGTTSYRHEVPTGRGPALGLHGRAQNRIDRIGLVYWRDL